LVLTVLNIYMAVYCY